MFTRPVSPKLMQWCQLIVNNFISQSVSFPLGVYFVFLAWYRWCEFVAISTSVVTINIRRVGVLPHRWPCSFCREWDNCGETFCFGLQVLKIVCNNLLILLCSGCVVAFRFLYPRWVFLLLDVENFCCTFVFL